MNSSITDKISHYADKATLALPIIIAIVLLIAYGSALVSPGLLDEQYLIAWLGAIFKQQGSSGINGFMAFPGLDAADQWGITGKLSLLILILLSGKNLTLLKLASLCVHSCCTFLTFLCGKQIGLSRSQALIAAVLFAFYPLHFEATAWLGGLPSELGAGFLLAALFIHMQQRHQGLSWLRIGLVGLLVFLAISSSALLWTACLTFALVDLVYLILPDPDEKKRDLSMSLISILMPILVVGAYLAATGGIAASLLPDLRQHNLLACLRHMFVPINESNWKHYSKEYLRYYCLYPFIAISFVSSCLSGRPALKRASLFSFLLTALLLLPVIGLALVNGNLYGERWVYAASAPLCIFLASCIAGCANLPGKFRVPGIAGATILTLVLASFFLRQLMNENAANRNYARVLKSVQKLIKEKQERDRPPIFIIRDIPERMSICPHYSPRGPVFFAPEQGLVRSNPIPDGHYKEQLREGKLRQYSYRYEDLLKSLLPLDLGEQKARWPEKMTAQEFAGRMEPALNFYKNVHLDNQSKELVLDANSPNGPVITIDPGDLSTTDGDYLYLDAIINSTNPDASPRIEMYWKTGVHPNYEKRERFSYVEATVNDGKPHRYLLSLRRNGWTTGGEPILVVLGFPARSHVRLQGAGLLCLAKNALPSLVAMSPSEPSSHRFTPPFFDYPSDRELGFVALPDNAEAIVADYSVADIAGSNGVSVELSYPSRNFDDANSNHLSGQTYKTFSQKGQTGRISIPITELPDAGVYSLRVIAKAASGAYIGQFSDHLCFQVAKAKKEY